MRPGEKHSPRAEALYRGEVADIKGAWAAASAVEVTESTGRYLGRGFYSPRSSLVCRLLTRADEPIDAGNAGTLMRLLTGILAGQEGRFEVTGDESLRTRPMDRIAEPLKRMGAKIETTNGLPPVVIHGSAKLKGIEYALPVASAQVKSAVLLAGLNAKRQTTVIEPMPTRDHTELMLEAAGAQVRRRPGSVSVEPAGALRLPEGIVPGDFSSAAPFIVAATLLAGSELTIHGVTRTVPLRVFTASVDERLAGQMWVTVVATGFALPGDVSAPRPKAPGGDISLEPPSFLT